MEPSLSLDASIVLRSAQDESRYGARVVFDPASGAMRSDHDDRRRPRARRRQRLRAVAGRWLFDAAPESRVSINGVAVGGARIISAGDVITIAGSQLLVEEATPATLALRRFDLVGNDTLPPVGDSVRMLAPPAEDLAIDLGEVPEHRRRSCAPRVRSGRAARWNYAAWVMGGLLAVVLACSRCSSPSRSTCSPGDAARQIASAVSRGNRPRACSCSRASIACAPSARVTCPPKCK